jgi:hypothetical protein
VISIRSRPAEDRDIDGDVQRAAQHLQSAVMHAIRGLTA